MISIVQELVQEDCQMSTRFLADCLEIGKSTVQEILTQDLQMRNGSSVWVSHALSEENKVSRVNSAKHITKLFFRDGMDRFCYKLVESSGCTFRVNQVSNKTVVGSHPASRVQAL